MPGPVDMRDLADTLFQSPPPRRGACDALDAAEWDAVEAELSFNPLRRGGGRAT